MESVTTVRMRKFVSFAEWCRQSVGLSLFDIYIVRNDLVFRFVYSSLLTWLDYIPQCTLFVNFFKSVGNDVSAAAEFIRIGFMGGAIFLSWGQRGGRQKGTEGQKTRASASLSEVNPNTPVRLTQNMCLINTFSTSSFRRFPPENC